MKILSNYILAPHVSVIVLQAGINHAGLLYFLVFEKMCVTFDILRSTDEQNLFNIIFNNVAYICAKLLVVSVQLEGNWW